MSHWSIAKRLKTGFTALGMIVLLLALGVIGSTLFLKTKFDTYNESANLTQSGHLIVESLFEAQIAANRFVSSPSDALVLDVRTSVQEAIDESALNLAADGIAQEDQAALAALGEDAAAFLDTFDTVVTHQAERTRIFEGLSDVGPQARMAMSSLLEESNTAEDTRQAFGAARVQESLLLGRFYMERFMLTADAEAFETSQGHLAEASERLARLANMAGDPASRNLLTQTNELIDQYIQMAQLVDLETRAMRTSLIRMEQASATIRANAEAMIKTLHTSQKQKLATIEATFVSTSVAVTLAAALALVSAVFLARATIRSTRRDVEETIQTVSQLAEGNLDIEILGKDRPTEMGQISAALEEFREKGRQAAALAAQTERERSDQREIELRAAEEEKARANHERAEAEQRVAEERKREIFDKLSTAVSGVVAAAAGGDFSRRVDTSAIDPELASLADEINRLMTNVDAGLNEIAEVSARLADGDLREGMRGSYSGTFKALQNNIEAMIDSLGGIIGDIREETRGVAGQSAEMTRSAEDLARRAESQAASLEETSAAMTQIASSAESNAHSASETDAAATAMNDEAGQARQVLEGTVAAMRDIEDHSKEIEAIVDVIEDIAFQTNLLSLNASVEAARAGEAGKGFAVVANEVRALAQRSADASSRVQSIITQSTSAISRGSTAVGETGDALSRIVERIETVSSNLREIRSSSEEQATAVKDISNAFGQLDKITQKNAAVAEETRGAASLLAQQSERMTGAVGQVRTRDVDNRPKARPNGEGDTRPQQRAAILAA